MHGQRDRTIDSLRGLAILIMIAANSSASVYAEPHPFCFRCLSSVAAPLFITLSGMMVRFSQVHKGYPLRYFLTRGLMLVAVAAFLDVAAWQMVPFTSFDVLYVLGISAPVAFLFGRINRNAVQWILIAAVFLLTPVLQYLFGYTPYPSEFNFDGTYYRVIEGQTSVLNHLFIDGWFPVFPWLGFSLLGVMLARCRWPGQGAVWFYHKRIALVAIACIALGALLKLVFPVHLYVREGFGEVFYPPTVGFSVYTAGIILALLAVFDKAASHRAFDPLATVGRSALFLYVLHVFLINYVFSALFVGLNGIRFALFWLGFAALMTAIAYGLRLLKTMWQQPPWFCRFLLGG